MNLSAVGADIQRLTKTAAAVADSESLVKDMTTDIRTISYLLHPLLLDEAGLTSALQWYVQGLTARSAISVDLEVPDDFDRLPRDLETANFRVVKECLTNVHRHSGSPVAKIRLGRSATIMMFKLKCGRKARELNPDELLNQDVKTNALGRVRPVNLHEMMDTVRGQSDGSLVGIAERLRLASPIRSATPGV